MSLYAVECEGFGHCTEIITAYEPGPLLVTTNPAYANVLAPCLSTPRSAVLIVKRYLYVPGRGKSERKGRGRERKRHRKGGTEFEVKLWQKRKKSQVPQPGIEPGTPANAAGVPGSNPDWSVCDFFRFCQSFTSNLPSPLSLPLSFSSSSFAFLFLSLRPFVCAFRSQLFAFIPLSRLCCTGRA